MAGVPLDLQTRSRDPARNRQRKHPSFRPRVLPVGKVYGDARATHTVNTDRYSGDESGGASACAVRKGKFHSGHGRYSTARAGEWEWDGHGGRDVTAFRLFPFCLLGFLGRARSGQQQAGGRFSFLKGGPRTMTVSPGPPEVNQDHAMRNEGICELSELTGWGRGGKRGKTPARRSKSGGRWRRYISAAMVGETKLRPSRTSRMAGSRSEAIRGLMT